MFRSFERNISPSTESGQAISFRRTKQLSCDGMATEHDGRATRHADAQARRTLLDALYAAGRELSVAAVMFHTALAANQGLSATEEKALDLLDRDGPLTGRQLAKRSGLAPASVTNLVDRLEAKGFARRTRNPHDGRSVLIEAARRQIDATARLTSAASTGAAEGQPSPPSG